MGGECGPLSRHAIDGQTSAMAIEDVLDQSQAEPGAALSAALGHIHSVETLRQPRQVLGCDAGTMVAHLDDGVRLQAPLDASHSLPFQCLPP